MNKYILVLDAGTGSARSVIFDHEGNQISISQKEWTHRNIPEYPGSMEFETDKNWETIKWLIKSSITKAGIKPDEIMGISSSSMREGIVVYDKNGSELWACANVDSRAYNEVIELKEKDSELEKDVYNITGETFALSAIPRLLWIKKNKPELFDRIDKISMLSDWILYKLSGKIFTEPSNGSTSGIIDLKTRNWSEDVIKKCSLPDNIYPEVVEPGTVIGNISEKAAEETGLSPDTKIVMGGGDAQLGCLGLGSINPGEAVILGGSFWQQEVNIDRPLTHPDAKIRVNCHAVEQLWQLEGISFFSGLVMRWFIDAFFQDLKETAQKLGSDPYSLITENVKNIPPGSYGLIPVFSDIMNFIHWKHASPSFLNFKIDDAAKYNRFTFFRSLMENAGFVAYGNLKEIEKVSGFYPEKIIFAGGSSKNAFFASMLSDILNSKIVVPKIKEATSLGAAMLVAKGLKIFSSYKEAVDSWVKVESTFYPDPKNHNIYEEFYNHWKEVYREVYRITDRGMLEPMWASPGT